MKTIRRLLVWLVLIAAVVAGGMYMARPQPPVIAVHTVARGLVESTVANTRAGTINANLRAKLAPSMGGQVDKLLVKKGDHVKAGQVLIELWHRDLDAQLLLARSEAERATAMAEEAQLKAEFAERDAKRQETLQQQDISAGGSVDRFVSDAKAARAAQRAALADAASRKNQIDVISAQIERMTVKAPFSGIVAELNGEIGEFVTPSPVGIPTPPAVDLIDDGVPYVTAPIDEVDAARVRVGMPARVTIDAFGKRPFQGKVRRIAPYVMDREKQARTVDVEVAFIDPPADANLLPGYSADVEILIETRADVLRIPTECLREGGKVLLVQSDHKLAERTIEPGLANWRFTEVVKGLEVGERIVGSLDLKGLAAGSAIRLEGEGSNGKSDNKP